VIAQKRGRYARHACVLCGVVDDKKPVKACKIVIKRAVITESGNVILAENKILFRMIRFWDIVENGRPSTDFREGRAEPFRACKTSLRQERLKFLP
jgi:hypothetical protein